jgi:hypothetical protein
MAAKWLEKYTEHMEASNLLK